MKGCELDTDGDGNCPVHPRGCPRPTAQHSPVPWRWAEDPITGAVRLLDANGRAIIWPSPARSGGGNTINVYPDTPHGDVDSPNARLIAAAPELLAALEAVMNCCRCSQRVPCLSCADKFNGGDGLTERVSALIRRIKGTPP